MLRQVHILLTDQESPLLSNIEVFYLFKTSSWSALHLWRVTKGAFIL